MYVCVTMNDGRESCDKHRASGWSAAPGHRESEACGDAALYGVIKALARGAAREIFERRRRLATVEGLLVADDTVEALAPPHFTLSDLRELTWI